MKKFIAIILLVLIALPGCAWYTTNMRKVSVGMTRNQVMEAIGDPKSVNESKRSDGNLQEVWEYPAGGDSKYWIYFSNGKVTSWKRTATY
jgi:hypothetical protein